MPEINFYFQVHQPYRLRKYRIFDVGKTHNYFDGEIEDNWDNQKIFQKVANKCYLPTNKILLDLIKEYPEFKFTFSFSGVFLEQAIKYSQETLDSFKELIKTGNVEILSETYYHSLAFLYSPKEFFKQIKKHYKLIKKLFNYSPRVFRNTELIYNNELAKNIEKIGFKGILTEGVDKYLKWRNPNFLYKPINTENLVLFLKNYRLSDDIAFRFSNQNWDHYPLTTNKFSNWINQIKGNGEIINLFMDYETFGEHQWEDSGIFDFIKHLPKAMLDKGIGFTTPILAIKKLDIKDSIDIPETISWADSERDLSAWKSNSIQNEAFEQVYELENYVLKSKDRKIIDDWRKLQTSDHFYYMCTKYFQDGDVHKYFSPYSSPYTAFINFMNVIQDLKLRLQQI